MTNETKPQEDDEILGEKAAIIIGKNYILKAGVIAGATILSLYFTGVAFTRAYTPKQMKQYNEKVRIELELKAQDRNEINYRYNRLLENAKNFEDSLKIMKQKERAIKQSELEKGLR